MATITATQSASGTLRAELKEWERAFSVANGGRKAGKSDIKKDPEIAAKYKEYSRLKSLEAKGKQPQFESQKHNDHHVDQDKKKRKLTSPHGPEATAVTTTGASSTTPRKTARNGKSAFETPSKARAAHPATVDPYDSPSVLRRLFSPSTHMQSSSPLKAAIGPTPQRDGKTLGLFDLLSESGGSTATPSATRIASLKGMSMQTPSKPKRKIMDTITEEGENDEGAGRQGDGKGTGHDSDEDEEETRRGGSRTPASSGKRYMLSNLFATPTAWRYSALVDAGNTAFPTRHYLDDQSHNRATSPTIPEGADHGGQDDSGTPSFLKRSTSARYNSSNVNPTGLSPIAVRKPPLFVGKGLSAIVQGLRDMEEERMDEELDVLREIEEEQMAAAQNVDVPDSQAPGGNTFKKRGQKRTTRLVRMKPVIAAKPGPAQKQKQKPTKQSEESEDELVAIAETQHSLAVPDSGKNGFEDEEDDDDDDDGVSLHTISEPDLDSDDEDPDYDANTSKPPAISKSFSEKMMEAIGPQREKERSISQVQDTRKEKEKEKENKKPAVRKVNPQAHANYRSLKIRNRGGKGRGAGRFGRRR